MNRKQKIIVSVVGITIVLLALLGLTYAYFLTRIQGNTNDKSISVTTANLELTYADGNGTITSNNIMPGTTLTDKEFTVTNNGNATVDNYAVYLEELVNELTRPDDMVYTLTCTSSKENKTCKGINETTFPKLAGIIVTNSIDVGETQTYKLTVTYKEMGVDQSDDMGKKVSARVQIYNLQDIVDVTGTVTNAEEGDYVEMHSDPRKSMITTDNKYLIAAVEPGTHTLYVKDASGKVKGSKEIAIKKGSTASVSGTNITVTNDSQTVKVDIKSIASTLTIDIGETKDYMPFDEGTLAYNILNNAKNKTNGTEFLKTPKTKVAEESSYMPNIGTHIATKDDGFYGWDGLTYGSTQQEADSGSNKISGDDNVSKCNSVIGKHISDAYSCKNYCDYIGVVESCTSDGLPMVKGSSESTLSIENDDYGTSYYFRGNVKNNYVSIGLMCWQIVRINGDGTIKLILEDQDYECQTAGAEGAWGVSTAENTLKFAGNFGYTEHAAKTLTASDGTQNKYAKRIMNYNNGNTKNEASMVSAFKKFQTNILSDDFFRYLDYLTPGGWCYGDTGYSETNNNSIPLTNTTILDKKINRTSVYYDSYIRLKGKTTKEPTLKCNGTKLDKYSDDTDMYVGTITADEAMYAGATIEYNNVTSDFYMINDRQKTEELNFWTITPENFYNDSDFAFIITNDGILASLDVANDAIGRFRPAINLKAGIKITGGDGTKTNPYIVTN